MNKAPDDRVQRVGGADAQRSSPASAELPGEPRGGLSPSIAGALALLILALSTVCAVRQSPHPNAYRVTSGCEKYAWPLAGAWGDWAYPVERNAFLRLPTLEGRVLGLYACERSDQLWVLSETGSLLHSPDFGSTWQDWTIPPDVWRDCRAVFLPSAPALEKSHRVDPSDVRIVGASFAPQDKFDSQPGSNAPIPNAAVQRPPDDAERRASGADDATTPIDRLAAAAEFAVLPANTGCLRIGYRAWIRDGTGRWSEAEGDPTIDDPGVQTNAVTRLGRSFELRGTLSVDGFPALRLQVDRFTSFAGAICALASPLPGDSTYVDVFESRDGGKTWQSRRLRDADAATLQSGTADDARPDVVADPVFWAVDGASGLPVVLPYRKYAAPWYFSVFALIVLPLGMYSLAAALRRARVRVVAPERAKIELKGFGTSDMPIGPGDRDVLNLAARAEAMSRFLRNPETSAPLTIAVEGAWGSGKSSYLNLLRSKLEQAGFSTVQFNAWHHQTESSLLAALLNHIRTDGKPGWLDLRGLLGPRFRWRLLWSRFARQLQCSPLKIALSVLLGAFSLGMLLSQPQAVGKIVTDVAGAFTSIAAPRSNDASASNAHPSDGADGVEDAAGDRFDRLVGKWVLATVAFATTLLPTIRGLQAFGVNPVVMLKEAVLPRKPKDDSGESPAFRAKFAAEFREVTEAIGPDRKLVIFIDDLDRCDAGSAVEVLQAMNFLVTAGPCVIVAAFDPDYVRACIRHEYKALVAEIEAHRARGRGENAGQSDDFASLYLQKLIQIREPIPSLSRDQALAMFLSGKTPAPAPNHPPAARSLRLWRHPAVAIAAVAALAAVGVWSATVVASNMDAPGADRAAPSVQQQAGAPAPALQPGGRADRGSALAASATPGQRSGPWQWWVVLPAAAIAVLGAAAVAPSLASSLPSPVKDTAEFTAAVERYVPVLHAAGRTPREIKRLMNAMRLMVARQELLLHAAEQVDVHALIGLSVLYDLEYDAMAGRSNTRAALLECCTRAVTRIGAIAASYTLADFEPQLVPVARLWGLASDAEAARSDAPAAHADAAIIAAPA